MVGTLVSVPPPSTNMRPPTIKPAASCVASARRPDGRVAPVTGSRAVTVFAEAPDGVSPPAISRWPAPGSTTSRDMAAGSWYGAGMTWSTIAAAGWWWPAYADLTGPVAGWACRCAAWSNTEYASGSSEHAATTATAIRNRC